MYGTAGMPQGEIISVQELVPCQLSWPEMWSAHSHPPTHPPAYLASPVLSCFENEDWTDTQELMWWKDRVCRVVGGGRRREGTVADGNGNQTSPALIM
jgi:hypothetical protein